MHQRLLFILSVDIHQEFCNLLEKPDGNQLPINERFPFRGMGQLPLDNHFVSN